MGWEWDWSGMGPNSNYTLPNIEHDSTRLFWPTIRMSVSDSLCPEPSRAGGEFY